MKKITMSILLGVTALSLLAGCGSTPAGSAHSPSSAESVEAVETFGSAIAAPAETEPVIQEAELSAETPEPAAEANPVSEELLEEAAEEPAGEPAGENYSPIVSEANVTSAGVIDATELFSDRDLTQNADLSEALSYVVADGEDIHITEAGVYLPTGTASNVTVYVEADSEAKVQLVLDGLTITNDDFPCIYVTSADKVFVTTTETENSLSVTGTFVADGETNTDGVIFSREDLVLNGLGVLNIDSTDNGVVTKDDLKVTGGTYNITAASKAFEANDSIRISGGIFQLSAGTDALHAENDEDDTLGYIYICGGDFTIDVGDDGIHATSVAQIDGGTFTISAAEGIEGTYIQINDGVIYIDSWGDGINAAYKSSAYYPTIEINGGEITVVMGSGDTDGIDSNGDIIVNGGTIDVTAQSSFDYDGSGQLNGGTVIVNGQQVDSLPNQMMGGRGGRMG